MKRLLLISAAIMTCAAAASPSNAAQRLFGIEPFQPLFAELNPMTGDAMVIYPLTLTSGANASGGNALATDPTTSIMYAVVKSGGSRYLCTIDPTTGTATEIGNVPRLAGMSFDSAGQLYGVTGDGAAVPETLFRIDKVTAAATAVLMLGAGADGESIAFNPLDGLLYHMSGYECFLESIDLTSLVVTTISSSMPNGEPTGMAFDESGMLLVRDLYGDFWAYDTSGNGGLVYGGDFHFIWRGLAWWGEDVVGVTPSSWGSIKSRFREGRR